MEARRGVRTTARSKRRNQNITSEGDESKGSSIPCRDVTRLFADHETVACAHTGGCVPCAYKIGLFDVSLDSSFCRAVPNQRPELCRRYQSIAGGSTNNPTKKQLRVLLVGDGDFSFSLAMVRRGHNVVATSYESRDTLERVYAATFLSTLQELEQQKAKVMFHVDATNLKASLLDNDPLVLEGGRRGESPQRILFDRIIWNFPCAAVAKGQDGQNQEMDHNKRLIQEFVQSALPFLTPLTGQVHMTHKTKPPYDQWNLQDLVVQNEKFVYLGRIVFDRLLFPPYVPRKALNPKSFSCHDACTFVFGLAGNDAFTGTTEPDEPESLARDTTSLVAAYGPDVTPGQFVPVTLDLILGLRAQFMSMASGNRRSTSKKRRKR